MLVYYFFLLPISKLPYRVLYGLSDVLFLILFKSIKYRAKVVYHNIKSSFPSKSEAEIRKIMNDFYRHFCDVVVETIAGFSITEKTLRSKVSCTNYEILTRILDQGKSVVVTAGHYNNWELTALAMPLYIKRPCIGIYKPLNDKFLDHKLKQSREKFGITFISTREVGTYMETHKNTPTVYFFLTDQSPSNPDNAYWIPFLNRNTAVLKGAEKYAKMYDCAVVYGEIQKVKRGVYTANIELLTEQPQSFADGELTRLHTQRLEKTIVQNSSYWLWTHKRWKHKKAA